MKSFFNIDSINVVDNPCTLLEYERERKFRITSVSLDINSG